MTRLSCLCVLGGVVLATASTANAATVLTFTANGNRGTSSWFSSGWGGEGTGYVQGIRSDGLMTLKSSTGKSANLEDGDAPPSMRFVTPNPHNPFGTGTRRDPFVFDDGLIGRLRPVFGVNGKIVDQDAAPRDSLVTGDWGIQPVKGILIDAKTVQLRAFGYAIIRSDTVLKAMNEDLRWVNERLGAVLTVTLRRENGFPAGERLDGTVTEMVLEIQIPSPPASGIGLALLFNTARRRRGR